MVALLKASVKRYTFRIMVGKFIVIEGSDGSGKGEQTIRLVKRIKDSGRDVAPFDFPRYDEPSSWFIKEYLNGNFGTLQEVGPKTASLFYALDRYAAAPAIRAALVSGAIVISNRYVASNLGHQGAKYEDEDEQRKYFEWDHELEYAINKIPKPDLNIILHVPAEIAQGLVDRKNERKYLAGKKRDVHEADINHLKRSEGVYRRLAVLFPDDYFFIECVENGKLLSIEEVHEKVWAVAQKVLNDTH
jgi:dTMP kinase